MAGVNRPVSATGLVAVLLFAWWVRAPLTRAGLPYFYQEDEGHHFNRLVEMVKHGTFDPHYFHKPSLHFYLRMPVIAAAFVWSVRAGEIRSIQEIDTRDPQGIGGWAFSASHPRIVRWTRGASVVFSLLIVLVSFFLAREFVASDGLCLGAAWLAACAPALVADSAKIGVDTLVTLMSLLAAYLAVRLHDRFSIGRLIGAGMCAGLAVSSKYNAAPIAVVPLLACLALGRRDLGTLAIALVSPLVGFLAGTPYALVSFPQFLDEMAFEVWHYGTAGHAGATGTPGISQAWFYLKWFGGFGLGLGATLVGVLGVLRLAIRPSAKTITFLAFPVLFFGLMIAQKVNFTRNVLPLVPFLCVSSVVAVNTVLAWRWFATGRQTAALVLLTVISLQPLVRALSIRQDALNAPPDSRVLAGQWLSAAGPGTETAFAAELQFPRAISNRNGEPIETERLIPTDLYLQGFDRIVADSTLRVPPEEAELLEVEKTFRGEPGPQRIRFNPEIQIYRLHATPAADKALRGALERPAAAVFPLIRYPDGSAVRAGDAAGCYLPRIRFTGEQVDDGCWVRGRLARVMIEGARLPKSLTNGTLSLELDVMSPWADQQCSVAVEGWQSEELCKDISARKWRHIIVRAPADKLRAANAVIMRTAEVHPLESPRPDGRAERVGVAIRNVAFRNDR